MTIENDVKTHIATTVTGATVYMTRAPTRAAKPYIVQRLITKNDSGMGNSQARFQFDVITADPDGYGQGKTLAVALTEAIRTIPDVVASYRVMEMELFDNDVDYYRIVLDAMVYFEETTTFG